jgi:hypothetical protein
MPVGRISIDKPITMPKKTGEKACKPLSLFTLNDVIKLLKDHIYKMDYMNGFN